MEMSSIEARNITDDGGFQTNGNPRAGFEYIRLSSTVDRSMDLAKLSSE
jgi:hypothetical protein